MPRGKIKLKPPVELVIVSPKVTHSGVVALCTILVVVVILPPLAGGPLSLTGVFGKVVSPGLKLTSF